MCCGCAQTSSSRSSAALQPLFSHTVFATGSQTICRMHAEDRTPWCMMRSHADSHAAPVVGTTSDLQCASAGLRCCTFQVAGARAARVWLTCRCLSAVPQVCTPCSAAPPRGPIVHPRVRAMRLHVFSGRSVQRWPRTRRSSDPLQMRASGPYFRPKAQIHHRELESGVGMRVRSRPDASAAPAAPSSATTPRPCMRGSAHLARQAGCAHLQQLFPAHV